MKDTDIAWQEFINNGQLDKQKIKTKKRDSPKCSAIYISTKTKIGYLSKTVDLSKLFWNIPVFPYYMQTEGVIKKQMKTVCTTEEESVKLDEKIKKEKCIYVDIINQINNPNARKIKYKDVRKINIGLSKKDLVSYRITKKGAFYNCIVLIIRLCLNDNFKDFHIKVFNTGKLEIPGIQTDETLFYLLDKLVEILQPFYEDTIYWKKEDIETVLINSNFTSGFYIDRDKFYHILKFKYGMHAIYDACSYP